jgi:diguanylate cyclase
MAEAQMQAGGDRHERTIAFAERAIARIKVLRQPAEPRDYEIWYNYATDHIPALNQAIDATLACKGNLDPAEVDAIHETYFSPVRLTDRIDSVGSRVATEIDRVMNAIQQAGSTSAACSEGLSKVHETLAAPTADALELRATVAQLLGITQDFARAKQTLELQLNASRQKIQELQDDLEAVRHESLTDPLTTLANRKCFDHALAEAIATSATTGTALSLLMIDIDHFKTFNDTFGHVTGDQVLRLVALCLKQSVKGQDIAARYGGEEFAVVLPRTGPREAMRVADHIRRAVMGKELMKRSTGESLGRITVSIGVAGWRFGDTMQTLIERADECLYAAKRSGRNRAICEAYPTAAPEPRVA